MKASQIMYRAAELVAASIEAELKDEPQPIFEDNPISYWGGCELIEKVGGESKYEKAKQRAQAKFEELFDDNTEIFWFGRPSKNGFPYDRANVPNQQHRLMAMLLTATVLEQEGS